jgi:hypothetical protein
VIALGDLEKYVDPATRPANPWAVIEARQHAEVSPGNARGSAR